MTQVADISVSRRKFDREVAQLREIEPTLVARGWWIMSAEFPYVKVAFVTVGSKLRLIPFAVRIDFTDYDAKPLAITFVDPFDDRELAAAEMITKLPRAVPPAADLPTELAAQVLPTIVELYQHYPQVPHLPGFLCLPGTRAYHAHPAHSGDPWELHRGTGEGRMFALLEVVWRYGTASVNGIQFNLGLSVAEIPS